jgi:Cytochrome P460
MTRLSSLAFMLLTVASLERNHAMRIGFFAAIALALFWGAAAADSAPQAPRYTAGGALERPSDYREWVYLSSGLGMTYKGGESDDPMFTNVFVAPDAYRAFTATGKWPDKTVFVVEERGSSSRGSINKGGRYQGELLGLAVEVKDESRFPEKWAYFSFSANSTSSAVLLKDKCWQCHEDHAAVDHSFVQFYPTLQPIARRFGTYREPPSTPSH